MHHRATGCPDELPRMLVRTTVLNDDIPRNHIEVSNPFDLAKDRRNSEYYHPPMISSKADISSEL